MQRIYTERAHLMCPNMFFGIVISIDAILERDKLYKTCSAVSEAHPFLRALLGQDEDGYYYNITDENRVQLIIKEVEAFGIDDEIIIIEVASKIEENTLKKEKQM